MQNVFLPSTNSAGPASNFKSRIKTPTRTQPRNSAPGVPSSCERSVWPDLVEFVHNHVTKLTKILSRSAKNGRRKTTRTTTLLRQRLLKAKGRRNSKRSSRPSNCKTFSAESPREGRTQWRPQQPRLASIRQTRRTQARNWGNCSGGNSSKCVRTETGKNEGNFWRSKF